MSVYVVLAVSQSEDGINVDHVATCLERGDADHLASLVEGAGVIAVGDTEYVNPEYAGLATPEVEGT